MTDAERIRELEDDLTQIGNAFGQLYLQALNGIVCDPKHRTCDDCRRIFELGTSVLNRHDPAWGNIFRSCPTFTPRFLSERQH